MTKLNAHLWNCFLRNFNSLWLMKPRFQGHLHIQNGGPAILKAEMAHGTRLWLMGANFQIENPASSSRNYVAKGTFKKTTTIKNDHSFKGSRPIHHYRLFSRSLTVFCFVCMYVCLFVSSVENRHGTSRKSGATDANRESNFLLFGMCNINLQTLKRWISNLLEKLRMRWKQ